MTLLGALFDYDGTIADTKGRQFEWYKEWARQNKVELKFEDGSIVEPDNLEGFLSQYNRIYNKKDIVAVYTSFGLPCDYDANPSKVWASYNNFKHNNSVKIFDGMKESLEDIWKIGRLNSDSQRNRSLRLAINTTNNWELIYPDLKRFGIDNLFDSYVTSEVLKEFVGEGGNYSGINKPSKVSIALMLDILGSRGETTVHIGDTIVDLRASHDVKRHLGIKNENLITIGVAWGYDDGDTLSKGYELKDKNGNSLGKLSFTHLVEHPSQLPGIIKQYL